jgi:hypothetical protein
MHAYYVTNRGRVKIVGSEPTRATVPRRGHKRTFPPRPCDRGSCYRKLWAKRSIEPGDRWTFCGRAVKPCTEFTDDFRPAGSRQVSRTPARPLLVCGSRSAAQRHKQTSHRTAPHRTGGERRRSPPEDDAALVSVGLGGGCLLYHVLYGSGEPTPPYVSERRGAATKKFKLTDVVSLYKIEHLLRTHTTTEQGRRGVT